MRARLGLPRIDLLGHSAGTNIATQYAARHPKKVSKLALIGLSPRAADIAITGEARRELAQLRKNEPWFPTAFAALSRIPRWSRSTGSLRHGAAEGSPTDPGTGGRQSSDGVVRHLATCPPRRAMFTARDAVRRCAACPVRRRFRSGAGGPCGGCSGCYWRRG
ncbi:alpha/beta fold hydrolase [Embleya sp. NPDC001921]